MSGGQDGGIPLGAGAVCIQEWMPMLAGWGETEPHHYLWCVQMCVRMCKRETEAERWGDCGVPEHEWNPSFPLLPEEAYKGTPWKVRVATEVSTCIVNKHYWASKTQMNRVFEAIWRWRDEHLLLPLAQQHTSRQDGPASQQVQPHLTRKALGSEELESLTSWPIDKCFGWVP